jgi:archaeosine synthase
LEKELQNHPTIASSLRIIDEMWKDEIILRTPTWSSYPIKSITSYGFTRPEIIAFQEKILERFVIPKNKKIIVLFPCSARKPYSDSRSHKLYKDAIGTIPANKWGYIQELILTSPLGVIPRELERVFPAAHYDIPVTGDWSYEEKEIAITQLVSILTNLPHNEFTIVAHVSEEYIELCREAEKRLKRKFVYTALEDKTTSPKAIANLSSKLLSLVYDLPEIHYYPDQEILHALADYQFGKGIGETLFTKCKIKGKPPLPFKILQGKDQIVVIQPTTGKLLLSMKTGEILAKRKEYFVISNAEKLEGSALFAVGVVNADEKIRPSDDVIILSEKGELLGIGTAQISGVDMNKQKKGSVVKIRAKK